GLLTGAVQFLKYKNTPKSFIGKKFWLPVFISLIVALLIIFVGKVHYSAKGIGFMIAIHLAVFSSVYAIVGNISYISFVLKGKLKSAGGSVAHLGFGLIILGILISSGKKKIISWNKTGIAVFKKTAQEDPAENTTLFKGIKTDMHKYMVTYTGDKFDSSDRKRYYEIDFSPKNGSKGFKVYPNIIKNNKGDGFSPNPDAKHFLTKDIFVYITSFKDDERENDTTTFRNTEINAGDTAYFNNGFIVMKKANINPDSKKHLLQANETGIFLDMEVISKEGGKYIAAPGLAIKSTNEVRLIYDTVLAQNLILSFNKVIDAKTGKIEIGVKENDSLTSLLTLKVLEFPMIKLLWLGVIIMVVGLIMSIIHRVKSKPSKV
ncbi:MAG TPA: cytochrome c assembly protein, partial [Chitinophagaceae bacterium]|nr:cytochrome c assembly protein [Chitinophagaceae bacterium]